VLGLWLGLKLGAYVSTKPTAFSLCVTQYCHVTGDGRISLQIWTSMGGSVTTAFWGISSLHSAFIFLRWFKLPHINIQIYMYFPWWQGCKLEVFRWSQSRIHNNTRSQCQIFLFDSRSYIRSFFTSHSLVGNSCWNGTISSQSFVEIENSCCVLLFPLSVNWYNLLTAKLYSLYVKELVSEILEGWSQESDSSPLTLATLYDESKQGIDQ